jgi:hypothetical protein
MMPAKGREQGVFDQDEESMSDRSIIEAMCVFCGVTPLPAEV